jgi:hypothetical protein
MVNTETGMFSDECLDFNDFAAIALCGDQGGMQAPRAIVATAAFDRVPLFIPFFNRIFEIVIQSDVLAREFELLKVGKLDPHSESR